MEKVSFEFNKLAFLMMLLTFKQNCTNANFTSNALVAKSIFL